MNEKCLPITRKHSLRIAYPIKMDEMQNQKNLVGGETSKIGTKE